MKNMGTLVWITGYSGSGKTTVSNLVYKKLKEEGVSAILLDGDDIRSILGEKFGHTLEERRKLAFIYGRLCKKLCDCGATVVIATVAMFESVRAENRNSNANYIEVFLDVPLKIRESRDPKGLYRALNSSGVSSDDIFLGFEEPETPDLILDNYGELSPEIAALKIIDKYNLITQKVKKVDALNEFNIKSRVDYWDAYYKKRNAPIAPSSFAIFIQENYLSKPSQILEFGCGNGRDSFYFARHHRVIAIDESPVVIESNKIRAAEEGANINFLHGDFGLSIDGLPEAVDFVYSRFVIHAMPEDAETRAILEARRLLKDGGMLFLEFRTTLDALMNEGQKLSHTERVTDHYRRFIVFSDVCKKLVDLGFSIDYSIEKQGLASHGDDNPVVGRIVAKKDN